MQALGAVSDLDARRQSGSGLRHVTILFSDIVGFTGVIHCDLKPRNILVRNDDSVMVMDFGISVLSGATPTEKSSSTTLLGTPAFIAPEMIRGGQ